MQLPHKFWALTLPMLVVALASQSSAQPAGTLDRGAFRITWNEQGITGLATTNDPFGANLIAPGQHLDVGVKCRSGNTNWLDLDGFHVVPESTPDTLVYRSTQNSNVLSATQTFRYEGAALDWQIDLQTVTNAPVEVGDLAISIPAPGPGGDPKQIFERGFLRHQFISGAGSFLYFVRACGAPPYLVVTPKHGTHLEYSGRSPTGRGGAYVFIHSALTGGEETRGTWRQAHTSLRLDPAKRGGARARYGFRLQWANSYEEIRDILYQEGVLDIRTVPGMTIPVDLPAQFSLRTRGRIDSIQPEFPDQTIVRSLGQRQGARLYEVSFKKLGENKLTIRHDGNRETYLEYFVTEPLETVIKKRAAFLTEKQQIRDPSKWWDGVFAPYDMKAKVVRTIDDPDIFLGRMVYVLTCDDPGLCKAPYLAAKNVAFPNPEEIRALEYYLEHFVWGKLQRTDQEKPYPYGVYGTPNWYVGRDFAKRRALAGNPSDEQMSPDLRKEHVWRSYDYPHVIMLYYHMYEIARLYPSLSKYLDAPGYLERAFQTARAFFIYPYELYPTYYETYKWGLYNELTVLNVIEALEREHRQADADWLRAEWEKKVKYFVYDDQYPFRSEYAFDRTAFESSYALAKYGTLHPMASDTNLWYDLRKGGYHSHPDVKTSDSRAFMDRQLLAGLAVRGTLETSYYQLGADGGMSYMAAMGGWGILDYALHFAQKPRDWLQLGYASYLSSWCLVNSGTPESNYGFFFPGKENDGAAGWQFSSAKYGGAWMGSSFPGGVSVPRGPWHYDGEIDLGFGAALRMAATIVNEDPVFGWLAYGGTLSQKRGTLSVTPHDGLRKRFFVLPAKPAGEGTERLLKLELERDGFAAGEPIVLDRSAAKVTFQLENRTGDAHCTRLLLSFPPGAKYKILQDGQPRVPARDGNVDFPWTAALQMSGPRSTIQLVRD